MIDIARALRENDLILILILVPILTIWLFWKCKVCRNVRYSTPILTFSLLLFLSIGTQIYCALDIIQVIFLYAWLLFYIFVTYRSTRKVRYPELFPIKKIVTLIRKGEYRKVDLIYPRRPFYILSIPGRLVWQSIQAEKIFRQNKFRESFEIYQDLLNWPLLEDEKQEVIMNQAQSLLLLGDTKRAKSNLIKVTSTAPIKRPGDLLILDSQIMERSGDFNGALEKLSTAVQEEDRQQSNLLLKIYNNLARMNLVLSNSTNVCQRALETGPLVGTSKWATL
ncbi:MAG: hypothetical protein K9N11_09640 [Lentisphaeria bacterium]|nr:hypothetical protein [Candidatus Neomarinimicrobiota bacterium]MCF7843094.1 hypothetical protein [Lentisphaeria bacterium]